MKVNRSLKEIAMLMDDEQWKQFQEWQENHPCCKENCEKCKKYLLKFEKVFLNGGKK